MLRPPRFLRSLAPLLASALVSAAVAGCGPEPPTWVRLASEGADHPGGAPVEVDLGVVAGRPVRFLRDARGSWLETRIEGGSWQPRQANVWATRVRVFGRGAPSDGEPEALSAGPRSFRRLTRGDVVADGTFPPESFMLAAEGGGGRLQPGWLVMRLPPGELPPPVMTLRVFASSEDRESAARVNGQRVTADGFAVWPGEPVVRRVRVPEDGVLRFATSLEPAIAWPGGSDAATRFLVRIDGEVALEHSVPVARVAALDHHELALPPGEHRISFEVDGALAYAAFLAPVIGPRDVGSYGERPWGSTRPDIVVFLADTFRADNLRAYGSRLPLTPFLDELAERSLLFARSWSVATYTMPSHAALFTGLYARQTGATTTLSALPEEARTIAERLSEAGYRTGAVTDAVVVSQENNLDQGFEWFDERHDSIEDTVARAEAFLEADDGRPVFLFVQSYRAHTPYVVSDETRERLRGTLDLSLGGFPLVSKEMQIFAAELGIEGDLANLRKTAKDFYVRLYEDDDTTDEQRARYEALVARLHALYRGAAADLDAGVRAFHERLAERGLLDHGWFVFTSDHGEAFNEHDKVFHGGKVWTETTRVPLLISGPGVEPGVVDLPVSGVDFAPTIEQMAGLPAGDWLGSSVLTLARERPIFTFENQGHDRSTFAVIEGGRKVMGFEDPARIDEGTVFAAFDLNADPHEREDASGERWPRELLSRMSGVVEELMRPRYGPRAAPVTPERQRDLDALGYGGAGEDAGG